MVGWMYIARRATVDKVEDAKESEMSEGWSLLAAIRWSI